MKIDLEMRRRRAAYRACHRGTKELDILLGRFADARLPEMNDEELTEFEALLMAPDPEIQNWIMDPTAVPDERYAALVRRLKDFHRLQRGSH